MAILPDDEIYVMRTCTVCGGRKTVTGNTGNSSPCTKCDDRGKELIPISIAKFAADLKQVINKLSS